MDETTQRIFATAQQAKLHKDMCTTLSRVLVDLVQVFPLLEAVRPGCKAGMQALSALHLALEKAKGLLQYCASSSKLYLAMTGDSIVLKFSRLTDDFDRNLVQLAEIVSETLSNKVALVLTEVSQAKFFLDPLDKQAGTDIVSLLLKEKGIHSGEEVIFEQVATQLGLATPQSVLEEQQAIKKLLGKAQIVGDKKKASILLYFLHLLKNYRKNIKCYSSNDIHEEKSFFSMSPIHRDVTSPIHREVTRRTTVARCTGVNDLLGQSETLVGGSPMRVPNPPEQLRCSMSLQLMSDPVIIASGQTYERVFIERWFQQGHNTCPKTQEVLSNLSLTPNACVRNLIALWCQENNIPVPEAPLSPDHSVVSWNLESFSSLDSSMGIEASTMKDGHNAGLVVMNSQLDNDENCMGRSNFKITTAAGHHKAFEDSVPKSNKEWWLQNLKQLVADISGKDWDVQCRAANSIRVLTTDIPGMLAHIEDNIPELVDFLGKSLSLHCTEGQEKAVLILLDLSRFDRKNEERIVAAGVVPYLLEILKSSCGVEEVSMSLLMLLSCTEENRQRIGLSGAVHILVQLLDPTKSRPNEVNMLIALCNLSTVKENQRLIIKSGAVPKLVHLLKVRNNTVRERCLLLLYNISSLQEGRGVLVDTKDCIATIAEFLGAGTNEEQEQSAAVLLSLCNHSSTISHLIRQEGVTPDLLSLSVQGSERCKDTAWTLLQLLHKQQWQEEHTWASSDAHLQAASSNLFSDTGYVPLTYR